MKKILVLALATAAVVACKKTDNESATLAQGGVMNLVTSINQGDQGQGKAVVAGTSLPDQATIGVQLVKSTDPTALYPTTGDYTDGKNISFQYSEAAKGWKCNSIADPKKFILAAYAAAPVDPAVDYYATAFAYYPYTADIAGVGADATIPVSTSVSGDITIPATIDADDSKNVYTTKGQFAAEAEIDYMWATNTTTNKDLCASNTDADFKMNHGLARVSFVLTKKATITDPLFFEGFSMKSDVMKGANLATSKMNISTGLLTDPVAMQYNRSIKNYKVAESPAAAFVTAADLANYVWAGAVVAPTTGIEAAGAKAIQVDVTISKKNGVAGSVYSVTLPNTEIAWVAGSHYVYHIEMVNMNSLKVRQVTVVKWTDTFGGAAVID